MIYLRSLAFNIFFFGGLTIFLLMMLFVLPLPDRYMVVCVRRWSRILCGALKILAGVDQEVRGLENIPDRPVIFASKHQSIWETIALVWIFPEQTYVLKKELLAIPLWGGCAKACGHISVDREGGASALKGLVRESRAALEKGRHLIIFPEGTRSAPGETGAYHPGIAALYSQLSAPVVPVALNSGLYWGRRRFLKNPGTIVVEFLPPMPEGLDRRTFMAELERRIETASARLIAEARGSLEAP